MKILFLVDSLVAGGAERQVVESLKYLVSREAYSCEIVVFSDEFHYDYINELNVKVHVLLRDSKKDVKVFFKLFELIRQIEPDVVHSWSSMGSVYVVPTVKLLKIKFVNGFLRNAPLELSFNEWARSKITFPFSDAIVSNSKAGLDSYNVPVNKRCCLLNGFDFSRTLNLTNKDEIRKKYQIKTTYVVGMVARFSKHKDYETFIAAAQDILQVNTDVTFVCVGGGEREDEIKALVKPEYRRQIMFLGQKRRVLNIINLFDVGVLSTNTLLHGEGISNSVMEYMALKKPAVVTDSGGSEELIDHEVTGYLTTPHDIKEMAGYIFRLLENEGLSEQMGKKGYHKLEKEFSLDIMGKGFIQLYNSLI